MYRDLPKDFFEACSELGLKYDRLLGADLLRRYEESQRYYHNTRHIESVLNRIDALAVTAVEFSKGKISLPATRLAALYHDATYVAGLVHNELLSANMANEHMIIMGADHRLQDTVWQAIMATKNHVPRLVDFEAMLLCDADLYELGSDRYDDNGALVYSEYTDMGHIPEYDIWKQGRTDFLTCYLAHNPLFYLPGQEVVEARARENMTKELEVYAG